jgi:hypothetical protein
MYQQQIEFFWPLTEQIPLDLDFTESEKPKLYFTTGVSGSVLTGGNGTTSWAVPQTIAFHPSNDSVGYWKVGEGLQMHNKKKPNWLHQQMTRIFFGWKWENK